MELLLIRHGLPERVERADGQPADPALSALGQRQARAMAEWLAPEPLHGIYTSPMRRARETAAPLSVLAGVEAREVAGVAEMDQFSDSYVPLEELKATDYERWRELVQGGFDARYDLAQFGATVVDALESIVADNAGRRVAVVCHGGVINMWASHVLGMAPAMFLDARYSSINRFIVARSGEKSILSLNESSHLRDLV